MADDIGSISQQHNGTNTLLNVKKSLVSSFCSTHYEILGKKLCLKDILMLLLQGS